MPNSSSAFPASRMISRSESLPITIETKGLLIRSPEYFSQYSQLVLAVSFLQRSRRNIFPVVRSIERNLRACRINPGNCGFQISRSRGYSQHASAGCVMNPVAFAGAGVKNFYALDCTRFVQSINPLPDFKCPRISARGHYHASRSVGRPFEIAVTHPPL